MAKAKTIDRLALTRQNSSYIRNRGNIPENSSAPEEKQPEQHGEICPECGQYTFFPEAGCWNCKSCGYSYCDARR